MANKHQDFQSHTCSGNVGTGLALFEYGEGKTAKKFRMASNQGENTLWYDVILYDPRLAAILEPHLAVGRRVVVTGKLKVVGYAGKTGPSVAMQLNASGVNFMDIPSETPTNRAAGNGNDVLLNIRNLI